MIDFTLSPEIKEMRRKAKTYLDEHIIPNEHILDQHDDEAAALMKDLQARAKAMGMWAMFIGPEAGGTGTGFLPYAFINEILGRSPYRAARVRLRGARHRQRRDPAPVRHAGAEGPLDEAAGRRRHPLLLLDDRARGLGRRPDGPAHARRPRRRRVGDQRAQVVHQRRDRRELRDRHGRDAIPTPSRTAA